MCDTAKILSEYKDIPGFSIADTADKMGIAYESLKRILNEHDKYDLGVTKLISFITITGNFTLLDHIEARLGRRSVLVDLKGCLKLDIEGFGNFMRESGHALTALSDAFADGKITLQEARTCRKELMDLMGVIMQLLTRLDEVEAR